MSDHMQDHDAKRACACVHACVCGSMVSHTSCKVHVVVSRTSCKRCCHACTLHAPCNNHISGRHVTYLSSARDATMQAIVSVPTIVCSSCRTREPDIASIFRNETEGRWSWVGESGQCLWNLSSHYSENKTGRIIITIIISSSSIIVIIIVIIIIHTRRPSCCHEDQLTRVCGE